MAHGPSIRIGNQRFPLTGPVVTVGRSSPGAAHHPDIDLASYDVHHVTSRRHAELRRINDIVYLADLGSKNGTSVNSERLGPSQTMQLRDGDRLSFAGVEAWFAWPGQLAEGTNVLDVGRAPLQQTMAGPRPALALPRRRSWWRRLLGLGPAGGRR